MLKLDSIKKQYKVADSHVEALKGITINFRENEFVSILGPSGCGKTTLLNIIGGLDKYSSGDLKIYGKSTKQFKDHDWDVYRNHRVGFIFQSYNLIPHQTVLGNVELALTISGMNKAERTAKAKAALEKVGLGDQCDKRPNQLSGGQSQRVAIARSLVNDPDILLADEPTGALDTATSKQIMEIIKEIAKERLVIMVTHNPEIAAEYSTRIIKLLDGEVQSDSNPFDGNEKKKEKDALVKQKKVKAKMSFFTAFNLSLRNLLTKKRRSIMTCVAGSIGIIGVSVVLSISYGMQGFINKMQNDMLSGNPIEITETAFDVNSLFGGNQSSKTKFVVKNGIINVDSMIKRLTERANSMENMFIENNITKDYVEFVKSIPQQYLAATMYDYGLDVSNSLYTNFVEPDYPTGHDVSLSGIRAIYESILEQIPSVEKYASLVGTVSQSFMQAPDSEDYILSQYNLLGNSRVAENADEVMVVLGKDRTLADLLLAQLGYYTQNQFVDIVNKAASGDDDDNDTYCTFKYEDILGKTFTWYPNDSIFTENTDLSNPYCQFTYNAYNNNETDPDAIKLKVVGILEPKKDLNYGMLDTGFYYTSALAKHIVEQNWNSEIAKFLRDNDETEYPSTLTQYPGNTPPVPSGIIFHYDYYYGVDDDGAPILHSDNLGLVGSENQMMSFMNMLGLGGGGGGSTNVQILKSKTFTLQELGGNIAVNVIRDDGGNLLDWSPIQDAEGNNIYPMPNRLAIYPADFTEKGKVLAYLDKWNSDEDITLNDGTVLAAADREDITYTDMLSLIISMIKSLLQVITIALVGFTSLALVVSCVMIGIVTYVSVVERIKEIGVIRSLGGRKRDVSNLFIAETGILGFVSGMIGIIVTYILSGIINLIVGSLTPVSTIATFPISYAVIMLLISVGLTLISGFMPSRSAAKKDPAVALRTE